MVPDIEELIKKVNSLTLDKNRLRQKLTQLSQSGSQTNFKDITSSISQASGSLPNQVSPDSGCDTNNSYSNNQNPGNNKSPTEWSNNNRSLSLALIAGVECSTSCEEDLLFLNDLYRKRLDEYNENWDYLQSKCSSLLSELNALQAHYALLKKEKLDVEEKLKSKCDDCDKIKSELQTVALNYETQLSAMSEHLSMITSRVSIEDN